MRRKPAIILVFLLLIALGGAVFYHQLRKEESPGFTEVDAFLRQVPPFSKWELSSHYPMQNRFEKGGLWYWFGIRREDHIQRDLYQMRRIRNDDAVLMPGTGREDQIGRAVYQLDRNSDQDAALIVISRTNGKIRHVDISGAAAFREIIVRKFPQLLRYEFKSSTH